MIDLDGEDSATTERDLSSERMLSQSETLLRRTRAGMNSGDIEMGNI